MGANEMTDLIDWLDAQGTAEHHAARDEIEALRRQLAECERERDELVKFTKEFIEAWDDGMAGDSYLLRNAKAVLAKVGAGKGEQHD